MSKCGPDRYFDSATTRCAGCHEICYAWFFENEASECNKYCPNYRLSGSVVPSSPSPNDITEIVLYVLVVAVIVSVALGILVWRLRKRRRRSRDTEISQDTGSCQERTPIQEQGPEVGFSEIHIGNIDHPAANLLTTTQL